ncbi:hypothetical protein LDC_0701 [sediment metagenome]|uniref:Uncharacterized protein n=1 Tax=sediment metagenome TaxID=749907 RepID=D9PGQ4_9ZZZZ
MQRRRYDTKYEKYVQDNLPKKGNVRSLTVTNSQYERMNILLGNEKIEEKNRLKTAIIVLKLIIFVFIKMPIKPSWWAIVGSVL